MYGDVFLLWCGVMIGTTQKIINMLCNGIRQPPFYEDTQINQKQAAIMEDSKERWCDHGEVKVRRYVN